VVIGCAAAYEERERLKRMVQDCQAALCELLGQVPSPTAAEILRASDKMLSVVKVGRISW
jgi:hypothetical protein